MRIVVCVKQVPDTTDVKVDPVKGTLVREGVPSMINPFDQFALEEGLRVRDQAGGELVVLSMGPPQAKSVVMLSLAIGADRGVLLTDRAFAGADTLATSYTLSKAIEKVGDVDLVVCGLQAIDGDTAQVGPGIATRLGLPQVTYAERIEMADGRLRARRAIEEGNETVEARLPALVTMTTPSDFVPTNPPFTRIMKAKNKPYEEWAAADIGADPARLGLDGSATWVERVYPPPMRERGEMIGGSPDEAVACLIDVLKRERVL